MTNTENFCPSTDPFVAETRYPIGTTQFGYGDSQEEAVAASLTGRKLFGEPEATVVYRRTDRTVRRGKMTMVVYEQVAS